VFFVNYNGAEDVLQRLQQWAIRHVFGYPGDGIRPTTLRYDGSKF
jgi:thiamine pyrophosphate-dependent acetolactate synthase large subunit-like protein